MEYDPVVNGLHRGQLVEISHLPSHKGGDELDGRYAQLQGYNPDSDTFSLQMLEDGVEVKVEPTFVQEVPNYSLRRPGEGGAEDSFDVVLGALSNREVVGEQVAGCLADKGFCVVRVIQHSADREATFDALKGAEKRKQFGRLADALEEGYLGKGGRAKALWLDPEDPGAPTAGSGNLLSRNDAAMTSIAQVLMPYSEDAVGAFLTDRTPALVCLSMGNADEGDYEVPSATDKELGEYYDTWTRSVLRVVHFMGPSVSGVKLAAKEGSPLSGLKDEYEIHCPPGTMVVAREDSFDYTYDEPEEDMEVCWMQCFLMKSGPEWDLEGVVTGDTRMFQSIKDGPPPPAKELVSVVALAIQATANMFDHHKEWCCYMAGTDGQIEIPLVRFDNMPYYSEEIDNPQGTTFVKHLGIQEGIDMFDNRAFEIANADAAAMCPQCRQVLEVGCSLLGQRGITKKYCNTNPIHAGVGVGCDKEEWCNMPDVPRSVATNNQLAITANRFNYVFNLKGASYVCDTACSSSLIAAHLGKANLKERRWDPLEFHLCLGTNLTLTCGIQIGTCASHMLSPGGRCFTFNATANGYNRGDSTAGMMIKDGHIEDEMVAYFRGSQIGQDGRSASLSAPNGPAQEKCIWGAIREAVMQPPESTVWECHGTGTSLGDPIEVGAVRKVQIKMPRIEPLMISTSKSNIGHCEGSAAITAMCKCVMIVIRTKCAPTLHFKTLNPHLDHTKFDAIFCNEPNPYKYRQGHAQVSSFGVGGANGHAIFWGRDEYEDRGTDLSALFLRKLKELAPPISAHGNDPRTWEVNGLPNTADSAAKYKVVIEKDPILDEIHVKYEAVVEEEEAVPEYFCITGSHNDWTEDRMDEGDLPGLFMISAEVPESGQLDFRILAEGDENRVIGPDCEDEVCTSRVVRVAQEAKTARSTWRIQAEPESTFTIELLAPPKGPMTVTWVQEQ